MAALTVRNVPADVVDRLKRRARAHGRSMEAEVRHVLAQAVGAAGSVLVGDFEVDVADARAVFERGRKPTRTGRRSPAPLLRIRGKSVSESLVEDRR